MDLARVTQDLRTCRPAKKGDNIITPLARLSFPNLFEPRKNRQNPNGKSKYGLSLLIPPQFNIDLLKQDATRAARDKWGDKIPGRLKTPFLDAGDYEYEGYEKGWTLLRATCVRKPGILDGTNNNRQMGAEDEPDVYPGRWCIASLRAFDYDVDGNRGVAFGLGNVVMLDHDDPIGGRMRAEDEFDPIGDYEGGGKPSSVDSLF